MTDTLFADISEFQVGVDNRYTYEVLSMRSNDGTYQDHKFHHNYDWASASQQIKISIVYCFYRPNWQQTFDTMRSMIGKPTDKTVLMIDVEDDNRRVVGDHSYNLNRMYSDMCSWIGDTRKVIGYGNIGNLNELWPNKPNKLPLIIASYGRNVDYPNKFAHQFSDSFHVEPFGYCDINSADGYDIKALCDLFGINHSSPQPPIVPPRSIPVNFIPDMNFGDNNVYVEELQLFMNKVFPAYSAIPPIGQYGPKTVAVIREFAHRSGIMEADGYNVGPKIKQALINQGFHV